LSRAASAPAQRTLDKSLALRTIEIPGKGGRGLRGLAPWRGSGQRPDRPPQAGGASHASTTRSNARSDHYAALPTSPDCHPSAWNPRSRCRQLTCSSLGLHPPPIRPASIRTLERAVRLGACGAPCFRKIGCCHLSTDVCAHICMSACVCRNPAVIRTRRFEFIPIPIFPTKLYAARFLGFVGWPWRSGSYTSPVTHK